MENTDYEESFLDEDGVILTLTWMPGAAVIHVEEQCDGCECVVCNSFALTQKDAARLVELLSAGIIWEELNPTGKLSTEEFIDNIR